MPLKFMLTNSYNAMIRYVYFISFYNKKVIHREDTGDDRGDKVMRSRMPSGIPGQVLLGSLCSCFSRVAIWLTRLSRGKE